MKTLKKTMFLLFIATVAVSCRKDDQETSVDSEIVGANFEADFFTESDIASSLGGADSQNGYSARMDQETQSALSCGAIQPISGSITNFPFVFRINYGTGCTNANGVTRSGSLKVTLSGFVATTGSTMTIERENYYVNLRKVEGTITYTNQTTSANMPTWKRTVTNGKVTKPNGAIFLHSGFRIVKLVTGAGTPALADNVYHITEGTHTLQRPNGTTLTSTIIETLVKPYTCEHITQGKLQLQGTLLNGVLNYGIGTCDNQAIYTHSNGTSYNITL
ncbi:MAG: hypothetical protein ACOVQ2_07725 [Flavobacterium sp.]|jgi:hypothetical protein